MRQRGTNLFLGPFMILSDGKFQSLFVIGTGQRLVIPLKGYLRQQHRHDHPVRLRPQRGTQMLLRFWQAARIVESFAQTEVE